MYEWIYFYFKTLSKPYYSLVLQLLSDNNVLIILAHDKETNSYAIQNFKEIKNKISVSFAPLTMYFKCGKADIFMLPKWTLYLPLQLRRLKLRHPIFSNATKIIVPQI